MRRKQRLLTVETLYCADVVLLEFEVGVVALVIGCHHGVGDIRVAEPKGVAQLVRGDVQQVGAFTCTVRPRLVLVEVGVAHLGVVRMRQHAT